MTNDNVHFLTIQRSIFGLCPCCRELFRFTESKIFLEAKPKKDWRDILHARDRRLDQIEQRIDNAERADREKHRVAGRRNARAAIRRIDPLFTPRRLSVNDAKVLFHPVDYVVFRGMKTPSGMIREIIFLDGDTTMPDRIRLQKNIRSVIQSGRYEWLTIRVREDGTVTEE